MKESRRLAVLPVGGAKWGVVHAAAAGGDPEAGRPPGRWGHQGTRRPA